MKLNQVHYPANGFWETTSPSIIPFSHLSDNAEEFCSHTGVHQCVSMNDHQNLTEATYKEIASLIDGNFLNQKIRADALNGIVLEQIEEDIMRYRINSSDFVNNRIQYQCSVQFDEWDEIGQDQELKFNEQARMLLWVGNIRLHCTCPSFLYHGYQYLLHTLDASIYPETRQPGIQNPSDRGIVCKHLNRILRVLPFYSGQIASALKAQYPG